MSGEISSDRLHQPKSSAAKWLERLASPELRLRDSLSLLFLGPDQVEKEQSALKLAQNYLCETTPGQSCGYCGSCLRIAAKAHEALFFHSEPGQILKVEEIHGVQRFLSLQKTTSHRFVIFGHAEKMSLAAGNALLKIFEEPPPGTVFVLISPARASVPTTIQSRSLSLQFAAGTSVATPELSPEESELRDDAKTLLEILVTAKNPLAEEAWRQRAKSKDQVLQVLPQLLKVIRTGVESGEIFQDLQAKTLPDRLRLRYNLDQILQRVLRLQLDQSFHRDPLLGFEALIATLQSPDKAKTPRGRTHS